MKHESRIHITSGPQDPHAYDVIPLALRTGQLDEPCPTCQGRGQWNIEIDLVSFRSKRHICEHCGGAGWIETGDDPIPVHDIVMTPQGYPKWIIRYIERKKE